MSIYIPALRCIGNILTVSDAAVVDRCLWLGAMDSLTQMLYQSNSTIIKESLWAVSNITAGPVSHVEKFIESPLLERIMFLTENRNIDNRREALFCLCNAITGADV